MHHRHSFNNLYEDPYQTTNVYCQHPEVAKELQSLLNTYRKKIGSYPELGWIDKP